MSNYKTSIDDLYNLKSTLKKLKDEHILLQEPPADNGDRLRWRKHLNIIEKKITQTTVGIQGSTSTLYADPLTDPLLQIEEANPILLFPLRLETRFANAGTELWIRVYPDEIAIHTHEAALTASEVKAGSYYWRHLWKNSTSSLAEFAAERKKAWSQVANRFGVNRTAWILLKTRPTNLPANEDFSTMAEADFDTGNVETKTQSWSEAAKSYVMPDLLKLRMYIGGNLVLETFGNPIVQPLPVSPDPMRATAPADLDWKGTELAWLEDFDEAVKVGMAFKINLSTISTYDASQGISRITVMGVRTLFDQSPLVVPPPVAGAAAVESLLKNHQYTTRGLEFVTQGTPTNNTDEKRSGYREDLTFDEKQYEQDLLPSSQSRNSDEMDDEEVLAHALGLDPDVFQKLKNGQNRDHGDAVSMNKALYPATLGFFLRHLLHPLFKAEETEIIRSFFCSYVTGRGPVPALRTGPQPYGILPTSNFKTFQTSKADKDYKLFQKLKELLNRLDIVYETLIPGVPKLGQPKDPHVILDEILGLYPNSETFYQRIGYGEDFLRNVLRKPPTPTQPPTLLEQLIKSFSTFTGPEPEGILALKKIVWERTTLPLNRSKLVDVVAASETKNILIPDALGAIHQGKNYIQWLADLYVRENTPFTGIQNDYYGGNDNRVETPILYELLKHGMLLQLYKGVFHWLSSHGFLDPKLALFSNGAVASDFIASKEYLNFFSHQEDISPMELMMAQAPSLPFLGPGQTAASYFLTNTKDILKEISTIFRRRVTPEILHDFKDLNEFFAALQYLGDLTTARLERTMIEHIDCLTYRLDAWQTGLFYKKLEMNRNTGVATGTVLGAYGWLENLKPAKVTLMNETDLPLELRPGTGMPIIRADAQGGYIHAPSLTQAKAAALLRNAYLHHHDPADPEMMAVNLNSTRLRKALEMYEGIQMGHSINELLGYRLERFLHDQASPLDQYIPALRKTFPLGGTTLSNAGGTVEGPLASSTLNKPAAWVARLDGLAIVNAIKGNNNYPFGLPPTQLPATGAEADVMKEGIVDLFDCIDAMKDLMVAESIHQIVQGNTERAGALLKSIHEFKPPAKFESMQTPRTPAEILTHRASIIFKSGDFNNVPNPWPSIDMSPRALTEPWLNEWLGEIIGPPDTFQCLVTNTQSNTEYTLTLQDLNVQPIDLVYLVPMQFDKEDSAFSQRLAYYHRVDRNLHEEVTVEIHYDKAKKSNPSFADVLPLLKLLKEVVTNAKALDAADFDLKQYQGKANARNLNVEKSLANPTRIVDVGLLLKRKEKLKEALELLIKKLSTAVDSRLTTCATIRERLIECCAFEIRDAFPKSSVGEDRELRAVLVDQSRNVIIQLDKMLTVANQPTNTNAEDIVQSFGVFFGPAFKVLPVFHFSEKENDEVDRVAFVQDAYGAKEDIFSFITAKTNVSQEKHIQHWLDEILYLRPKLATFETTRLMYNSFREKQLDVKIMQLPYEKNDSWLGLEFPADLTLGKGKLSMLFSAFPQNQTPDWKGDFSGLLLDEWVEEIPGKEELTGITFQYNQPDSQPAQALLLAISPGEGAQWTWDKLSDILDDTLRRAKQRAVGTNELTPTDWIGLLPGALAEFSATKANVSLFFRN